MTSLASKLIDLCAQSSDPTGVLEEVIGGLSRRELQCLSFDWDFWCRENQREPEWEWRSWGALTGRGWGKTRVYSEFVNAEVRAGRAPRVALIGQDEDSTRDVLVLGESGLVATSPPWFRARWENGRVSWPNGAQAFIYSPWKPDTIFGPEHHLAWATEIHAWPRSTMAKAFSNLRLGLRLGYGKLVWDSNPRRRHPLLKVLLDRSRRDPVKHVILRGESWDNIDNLALGTIEDWVLEKGGTQELDEMVGGKQFEDDEGAIFKADWIERNRLPRPTRLRTQVIGVDPATSTREGTDDSGIVHGGQGEDGRYYLLKDLSGRYAWEAWPKVVIDAYVEGRVDVVVIERNRGGDACVGALRAEASMRGMAVVVLPLDARVPGHQRGVVHVKETVSRQSKEVRAEAVAPLYEQNRVSHVTDQVWDALEDEQTTWEPGPGVDSPNRMDAAVFVLWELAGLWREKRDRGREIETAAKAMKLIRPAQAGVIESLSRYGIGAGRRGL